MKKQMIHKFEWMPRYETGIEEIDAQHKALFGHIDELTLAMYSGNSNDEIREMLDFLGTYVEDHFNTEQKLMADSEYPDYFIHKNLHKQFTETYSSIIADYNSRGADNYLAIRIEKEVRAWWEDHVLKADMQYVPYLRSRNKNI